MLDYLLILSRSNGPKWNEVASKALGLELVNLATGGATSDNMFVQGGTGPDSTILVPSTQDQIQRFLSEDEPRDDDVFVHWIGANDVLFNNTVTGAQITAVIKTQIDELRDAGAKTVIMANYNDMDTFPGTYKIPYYDTPNVRAYTRDMTANLQKLAYEYSSDDDDNDDDDCFTLSLIDVAALIRNITARPAEYNIDAKYVNPPTGCLTGVYKSEGVPRNLCKDPERHLWFDAYHLVKGVHELIGTLFETRIREIAHK